MIAEERQQVLLQLPGVVGLCRFAELWLDLRPPAAGKVPEGRIVRPLGLYRLGLSSGWAPLSPLNVGENVPQLGLGLVAGGAVRKGQVPALSVGLKAEPARTAARAA